MRLVTTNDQTDEQLMKLYQNGDEAAFKVLYDRHASKVYGFLRKRMGNKEKVDEIYQEVFIKIHKSKALYNDTFPVLPWIFTVTKSVLLDALRKNRNVQLLSIEVIEGVVPQNITVSQGIEAAEVLNQLPSMQKQAIEMRYINDKTFEQIAASLKIEPANARQIVSRGLKRLRKLIGEGGGRE